MSMATGDVSFDFGPIPFDPALAPTRSPLYHLMLSNAWMEWFGHIALQWGVFEQVLNEFIQALLTKNKTVLKSDFLVLKFQQRKSLCLDELAKVPELAFLQKRFGEMLDDAEALFLKRNAIVHGNIAIEVSACAESVVIASGRHKKAKVMHRYSLEELKILAHDLAYLSGRMSEVAKAESRLQIEPHERQQLQDFLRDNHPNPASGNMLLYWQPAPPPKDQPQSTQQGSQPGPGHS